MSEGEVFATKPAEGEPWDVAIIGSGPSALTAAIYAVRGAASTVILGGTSWGGQLMLTTEVDNFPGFPEGIQGPELMERMKAQAMRFGAEFKGEDVTSVNFSGEIKEVVAGNKTYKARSVIIATGAETRWLQVPGEDKLRGRGVSSCAPCDAPFFKDREVMVVGGGDAAMEEALVLTKYSPKVTMIHRRDAFKASQAMQQRVLNNEKIKIIWDTQVIEMMGEQSLEFVKMSTKADSEQGKKILGEGLSEYSGEVLEPNQGNVVWKAPTQGVFVAIGHIPSTKIFSGQVKLDEKGYVARVHDPDFELPDGFRMKTSVPGVFVAGDVHDFHYRQAITAAAYGCMAGMEALRFLDKNGPSW
jgi:thioredoxin reductase (NADPH)